MKKLSIGYFYKEELNLYGDNGNVEILKYRAKKRDIPVEVKVISADTDVFQKEYEDINLVFMGGGPDAAQNFVYEDLVNKKRKYLEKYINNGGVGLFICGSYQLLGNYYKDSSGKILKGLEIFNLYTEHFGNDKPRCIGNVLCEISPKITEEHVFKNVNFLDNQISGFENHGGRTYLHDRELALGEVIKGDGNNGDDSTEGIIYNNCIGTYFHGPFLARNPHIADYLIAKSLGLLKLEPLDDKLQKLSFTASKDLK